MITAALRLLKLYKLPIAIIGLVGSVAGTIISAIDVKDALPKGKK